MTTSCADGAGCGLSLTWTWTCAHVSPGTAQKKETMSKKFVGIEEGIDIAYRRSRADRTVTWAWILLAFDCVPDFFGVHVLHVLHDLTVFKGPYVGKDGVHYAVALAIGAQVSSCTDDGVSGIIKILRSRAVVNPLRRQTGKHVLPHFFQRVKGAGIREACCFRPLKVWSQGGLQSFSGLLGATGI